MNDSVVMPFSSSPPRPALPLVGRITSAQARMARTALGKTQGEVAASVGVALRTLFAFEQNAGDVSKKNANVIRSYYESLGIRFDADAYFHVVKVPK